MAAAVDALDVLERFERELEAQLADSRRDFILGICRRWQGDPDSNARSRQRARKLLARFEPAV